MPLMSGAKEESGVPFGQCYALKMTVGYPAFS